ncbi:glycoside hydrolase [Fulvivirga sp. 1062]|uniref:Glycoside hydrolase n=2 Tax=Fulvivirga sedimenti TaxID=2879465 RepID=A0A9X1HWX0_9BACT|nr:glycoside hydrolase [Fulvivirga sedimenti]
MAVPHVGSGQKIVTRNFTIESLRPVLLLPAVDRKSPENLTVLFTNGNVLMTDDAGETWNEHALPNPVSGSEGWIFSNKKGDLFYFRRISETALDVSVSTDGGTEWKEAGNLELPGITGYPSIFFDPDKERVMVSYLKENDCTIELIFLQSSNSRKWTDPKRLNGDDISCRTPGFSNGGITKGPQDYLFAAWSNDGVIYLDRSYDGGEKWLRSDIAIHPRKGASITGKPTVLSDNSRSVLSRALYVMWADSVESGYDILSSRSTNNGDSWTTPLRVHSGDPLDVRSPQMYLDQSNGFLYALYYQKNGDGTYNLFVALSDDGAQSFDHMQLNEVALNVENEQWLPLLARMDVHEGKVVVSWSSVSGNEQKIWIRSLTYDQILK